MKERGDKAISVASAYFGTLLEGALGRRPGAIATMDHVFASPPQRLVESHHRLMSADPLLVLYDVTTPDPKRYRSDLIVDAGVTADRDPDFHLWSVGAIFAATRVRRPNFEAQTQAVHTAVRAWCDVNGGSESLMRDRWSEICEECLRCVGSVATSATEFYCKWLPALYRLCGWDSAATLVQERLSGFYDGALLRKYIPAVIDGTLDAPYGLPALTRHGVFERRLVRPKCDVGGARENARWAAATTFEWHELAGAVVRGDAIPSAEVCAWAVALAGIPHFGNDRGFLRKLGTALHHLGVRNDIARLQLTSESADGHSFVEFRNPRLTRVSVEGPTTKMRTSTVKRSRYGSLPTLYVRFGKVTIQDLWAAYWKRGQVSQFDA